LPFLALAASPGCWLAPLMAVLACSRSGSWPLGLFGVTHGGSGGLAPRPGPKCRRAWPLRRSGVGFRVASGSLPVGSFGSFLALFGPFWGRRPQKGLLQGQAWPGFQAFFACFPGFSVVFRGRFSVGSGCPFSAGFRPFLGLFWLPRAARARLMLVLPCFLAWFSRVWALFWGCFPVFSGRFLGPSALGLALCPWFCCVFGGPGGPGVGLFSASFPVFSALSGPPAQIWLSQGLALPGFGLFSLVWALFSALFGGLGP